MLANRVAVVTGGGRGIGAATAKLLALQGVRVMINDLEEDAAKQTMQTIIGLGATADVCVGDITSQHFPDKIMQVTAASLGMPDILVNNAGFLWDGMAHKMSDAQWDAVIACHATAPFRLIRAAAPYMREAGKQERARQQLPRDRCIVNVSSISGLHGNIGQANYAFAKMGLLGLTKTIAKEWGPFGVRCNAVAFGMIETRMTEPVARDPAPAEGASAAHGRKVITLSDGTCLPQGLPSEVAHAWSDAESLKSQVPLARKGRVEEAAGAILMLCSPWAGYITGHCLECTGGVGI